MHERYELIKWFDNGTELWDYITKTGHLAPLMIQIEPVIQSYLMTVQ